MGAGSVFGDAGAKDVINFLRLKQLARLSSEDMKVVNNRWKLAGSSDSKKLSTPGFSLKFDGQKTKQAARKDRTGEEETWALFKFYPIIEELVENLFKGELPKNEYSCMNHPSEADQESSQTLSVWKKAAQKKTPAPSVKKTPAYSVRTRRTPSWAKAHNSDDGSFSDSILKYASADLRKMGQRIFVFIIGGATCSELRACYKLTTKLRREVVLGSTSFDDPAQYIAKLKLVSGEEI